MLRNGAHDWGSVAKGLHWLFVVLILVEVPAGLLMTGTYGPGFRTAPAIRLHVRLEQIHHTIGLSLLALLMVRLAWRVRDPAPGDRSSRSVAAHLIARAVQGLLCLLLALIPLSGWAALSALGDSPVYGHTAIWLFDIDRLVPKLFPAQPISGLAGYSTFARLHLILLYAGAGLVAMHTAAALWRHYRRRDYTLRSMWPLAGARRQPGPDRSGCLSRRSHLRR